MEATPISISLKGIMSKMIPLSVPSIHGNEWSYVKECIETGWVSSAGRYVDEFERKTSEYTGSRHAIACVNGTSALHISLILAGVRAGDEVIVPTLTFIAPVNVVRYLNADPVFMDSDEFYNINIEKTIRFIKEETRFENAITINRATNKRITAIIPVHVFGNAVDLEPLVDICKERNIRIVEDASESLGTYYKEGTLAPTHCGTVGEFGCLSFNGNKIITTGGGGMILTSDSNLAEKAMYLTTQAKDDEKRYIHNEIGYNFRLTNIQAAMGVAQLEQLPSFLEIKKKNFANYRNIINKIPGLHLADGPGYAENNLWMYALQLDKRVYGKDRDELMAHLSGMGIETRPVWYLNHLQKPYKIYQCYKIEIAYRMQEKTLNIPCSVDLTDKVITGIVETLNYEKL
jgi:perosamine synthetase